MVSCAAGQGQVLRRLRGADGKQPIHGMHIEHFEVCAFGDALAENGVAQILDEKDPGAQIACEHERRADAGFAAQPFGYREKRSAFARKMRDFAVWPAVADRRAVGLRRPVHQHRGSGFALKPGEQARRSVASDCGALGIAPAVLREECLDLAEALELLLPRTGAGQRNAPRGPFAFNPYLKPVHRQNCPDRLRPLRNNNAVGAHLVEAGLFLLAGGKPVEIAVIDLAGTRRIAVHQPVGRARHRFRHAERRQQPLREGGLARAQLAVKRDEIDRRNECREPAR